MNINPKAREIAIKWLGVSEDTYGLSKDITKAIEEASEKIGGKE